MRIAAIYIETHEYLFDEPQVINFGGEYFYNFVNEDGNIIVSRNQNKLFIPNFFDLPNLKSKVTNINAVVGQNGAGKSTILDIIRSTFIENNYALPYSKSLFIVESNDLDLPKILRNDFLKIFICTDSLKNTRLELELIKKENVQSIYYSPHFDYKLNPNFDNVDNHDLSFDKILATDLINLNDKDSNENGWAYSPSYELLFKNSIRQIEFLCSNLVEKQQIFKDLFQLQSHYEPILHFRGYKDREREWNTPYQFRNILTIINKKAEEELNDWVKIRKFKEDQVLNQIEVNRYILKRNVIKSIISLLYKQMERSNAFLDKAYFPYEDLKEDLEKSNAYELFMLFAKYGSINGENVLDEENVKLLLDKIYEAIEKRNDEDSVTNGTLKTSSHDAIEILRLQRRFMNELNSYHIKFYSNRNTLLINENEKLDEFINYMPFSRRMSSGENSLLNFYSRIYNFLKHNFIDLKSKENKSHFILLLDEADLSFHPSWKKKYVKALLKTLPYFFNELNNKPSIQIIFTTHDPLTLSDLPNHNVIYLSRINYDSSTKVLDYSDINRPNSTFGANISDLLSNSFFIEDSLIGNFVFDKIYEAITWLNDKDNMEESEYYEKLISIIDEPIVQRKLAEMFDNKMKSNYQLKVIEEQIKKLEKLKSKLRN